MNQPLRQINRNHSIKLLGSLALLTYAALGIDDLAAAAPAAPPIKTFFVSPNGSNNNTGSTEKTPLETINYALKLAKPGDTVFLLPGNYLQDVITVRSGEPNKSIRITGSHHAIVRGAGNDYVFDVRHSHININNFVVDGKVGKGNKLEHYRDKLIYIKGQTKSGVSGIKIQGMQLQNAYGECVRIKHFARKNELSHNNIQHCGLRDYRFNRGKHNGEAIYIGTAPEQILEGVNPSNKIDQSNDNWVHHNYISPWGSECVDIKEGSSRNTIEHNICTNQRDENVGGISVRGNDNTIRYNTIFANKGAGIRLGGDTKSDGTLNHVYGNYLHNNEGGGLKIIRTPQGKICGNTILTLPGQKKIRGNGLESSNFLKQCDG